MAEKDTAQNGTPVNDGAAVAVANAIAETETSENGKRAYTRKPTLNLDVKELRALLLILDGQPVHDGWTRRIRAKVAEMVEPQTDFSAPPA